MINEILIFYWIGYTLCISLMILLLLVVLVFIAHKLESFCFYYKVLFLVGVIKYKNKGKSALDGQTLTTKKGNKFKIVEIE